MENLGTEIETEIEIEKDGITRKVENKLGEAKRRLSSFGDRVAEFIRARPTTALLGAVAAGFVVGKLNLAASEGVMGTYRKIEVVREDTKRLLNDGKDAASDLISELESRVRKHPIAAILTGLGIGYLLAAVRLPVGRIASLGLRHALVPLLGVALEARLAGGIADESATQPQA